MKISTKDQLMEGIQVERGKLEKKISKLTAEELVFPASMGDWSVKDILAHLVDWEQRCIGWYEMGKRGETPVTPEPGYKWSQLAALNQKYYQLHKDQPLAEIQAQFQNSFRQIKTLLEAMPEAELVTPGYYAWTGKSALLVYFYYNTSSHYRWGTTQVRPKKIREAMTAIC